MKIIESILTNNPCYKKDKKITVKGLMLHSVGCSQPSAQVFVKNWNKSSYSRACVHGFIDANTGDVYQTLPWNHRGWHCGGSGNNTHIGVEMCEPGYIKYTGGSSFTCSDMAAGKAAVKRTYDSAVELFAMLCKKYKLDPLKSGVIVSHKEGHARGIATNHGDPEHLWNQLKTGYTMNGFRQAVKAAMEGGTSTTTEPAVTTADAALDKLSKLKVINSPDYWKSIVAGGKVKYLDDLLIKATAKISEAGKRSTSVENAVGTLVEAGVVSSPNYWLDNRDACPGLRDLLCALGGAMRASLNDATYSVRVTASALNIRTGPGTGYGVVGCIKDRGVYTIVEETNGWGRLKSGVGWISLSYCEKI